MDAKQEKPVVTCARCGHHLADPDSVRRGMGPDCWVKCGGDVYEKAIDVSPDEWADRENLLRYRGGETEFGAFWPYIDDEHALVDVMRVAVRYVAYTGFFEAYGTITGLDGHTREIVFLQSTDIRAAYEAAVMAGPQAKARAYKAQRDSARAVRRVA